jgi:serpin B
MLAAGAGGATKTTLDGVFVPESVSGVRKNYLKLPENSEKLPFRVANGIWVQRDFTVKQTYIDQLKSLFKVQVNSADFKTNASGEVEKINAWVANATENKITKLFGELDASTALVLVNAIDFDGKWESPFQKERTENKPFRQTKDKTVDVPMMFQRFKKLSYSENGDYQAVNIPFAGHTTSFVAILPQESKTLSEIESKLDENSFRQLTQRMQRVEVICELPKFKMETSINLTPVINAMGAGVIFGKPDLSGITDANNLAVSQFIQKVFVEVEEDGVKAAAATGVGIYATSAEIRREPKEFKADRPFLFVILDNQNNVPMFVGHFTGTK